MAFQEKGTLTTDKRSIAIDETWETQTDFQSYQSISNIDITNGVISLSEITYPENTIAAYDAQQLTAYSDGDTVGTWTDKINSNDATNSEGSATYRPTGINGYPALEFSGSQGYLATISYNQPVTVFAVASFDNSDNATAYATGGFISMGYKSGSGFSIRSDSFSDISGATGSGLKLLTGVIDGSNTEIREEGSTTAVGDASSASAEDIYLGYTSGSQFQLDGLIGEVVVVNDSMTQTEIESEEQRLADKWGITL